MNKSKPNAKRKKIFRNKGDLFLRPVHPGSTLRLERRLRGYTGHALSLRLRVPSNAIGAIEKGERSITPVMALRLGRFFGNGATYWCNLQSNYDLAQAYFAHWEQIEKDVLPDIQS